MGAFFLISCAIAFLGAAVFLRLRWATLLIPSAIAVYLLTPDGFFTNTLAPTSAPTANGNVIVVAGPTPALWLFASCIGSAFIALIVRSAARLSGYIHQKKASRRYTATACQSSLAVLMVVFGFAASIAFCTFLGAVMARSELNHFPNGLAYILLGLLTALAFIQTKRNLKNEGRNIAMASFCGVSALVVGTHLLIALLSHVYVVIQAQIVAGGKPYCLVMPDTEKPPRSLAFAEWPNFLSGSGCDMGARTARAVMHTEDDAGKPVVFELYRTKPVPHTGSIKAISCTPVRLWSLHPFPPSADTLRVYTAEGVYSFPSSAAEVRWRNLQPERNFKYEPTISIKTEDRDFYLSRPLAEIDAGFEQSARNLFSQTAQQEETTPVQMSRPSSTPDAENPAVKCNNFIARDGKRCQIHFYAAPFEYRIGIDEGEKDTIREIAQNAVQYVDSARRVSPAKKP